MLKQVTDILPYRLHFRVGLVSGKLPFLSLQPENRLVAGPAMFTEIRKRSTRQWEPVDTNAAAARQAEVDAYCALLDHSVRTAWVGRVVVCGQPRLGKRTADV